ncbi:MAG: flavin reductase, partial [Pseudomonadota bacterium]
METKLARAMAALTTGIYVLTVAEGARRHGMSSSWVTQVSGEPPFLMASVDSNHFTAGMISRTGSFGLNVVGVRGRALEDYFYS